MEHLDRTSRIKTLHFRSGCFISKDLEFWKLFSTSFAWYSQASFPLQFWVYTLTVLMGFLGIKLDFKSWSLKPRWLWMCVSVYLLHHFQFILRFYCNWNSSILERWQKSTSIPKFLKTISLQWFTADFIHESLSINRTIIDKLLHRNTRLTVCLPTSSFNFFLFFLQFLFLLPFFSSLPSSSSFPLSFLFFLHFSFCFPFFLSSFLPSFFLYENRIQEMMKI